MCGVISFTPDLELIEQDGELQEIFQSEVRPSSGQHHERIGCDHVRPGRQQRANLSLSRLAEEHAVLAPGVGEANHFVLTPAQRVERMGYTKSLRIAATPGS